jgi:hypothetical protein
VTDVLNDELRHATRIVDVRHATARLCAAQPEIAHTVGTI